MWRLVMRERRKKRWRRGGRSGGGGETRQIARDNVFQNSSLFHLLKFHFIAKICRFH